MKKLLIFDLDGTLLDTLSDLANSVNFALEEYHLEKKSREYVRKSIGNGVSMLVARCIPDGLDNPKHKEILATFRNYYSEHYLDNTVPYKGIKETLLKLKENGYILTVVSNKIDRITNDLISHFFPNMFEVIQGDTPTLNKKPHPDMVNHVLSKTGISKKDACYIGDTNVDYETAVNSKLDVLLVTYGYRTKEEMEEYKIDAPRVDSPEEILEFFTK